MANRDLTYRIEGLEQVIREIERRRLDARRSIRQMLAPGADTVRDAIRQRGKGRFQTQVVRSIRLSMAKLAAAALIGPVKKQSHIGRFLEYGTKPHVIRARRGGRGLRIGGRFVRQVMHPGARPYPFMEPGFEASQAQAMAKITEATRKVLGV